MGAVATASVARRSLRCSMWRTMNFSRSLQPKESPILRRFQDSPISSSFRLRRESFFLNSLLPIHTATASARLVSKLPNGSNVSTEGLIGLICYFFALERPVEAVADICY